MLLPSLPSLADYQGGVRGVAAAQTGPPVNVVAPFVSGDAFTGETLSCNGGSWSGAPPLVLTYQWTRDTVDITDETNSTYALVADDEDTDIVCVVTATNGDGSDSADSNTVNPTAAPPTPAAPVNTVTPAITPSTCDAGDTLTCSDGTWTGEPTPTLTKQWTADGVDITGETGDTYTTVDPDDVDVAIGCTVTASNTEGTVDADSSNTVTPAAPSGANVFVNDTFTDTDTLDLDLHTGETGATWTRVNDGSVITANAKIISNRARVQSDYAILYASGTPTTAEYDVEATFHVNAVSGNSTGIVGRKTLDNVTTCYEVRYDVAGTQWVLNKWVALTLTSLGTFAQTLTAGNDYQVKLQIRDATKKVFIDGVERISSTDNAVTATGAAGILGGVCGIDIDNFTATDA